MLAFHNDPAIKQKYLDRVSYHEKMDEVIQGTYWEDGKGCAVGCTVHSSSHTSYETELGIPTIIAKVEDRIFEGLPNDLAKTWPRRFLESIPIGKDLSRVWPKFATFLLMDATQCNARHPHCLIVADAFGKELKGEQQNWFKIKASAAAASASASASDADAVSYAADAVSYAAATVCYAASVSYAAAAASYASYAAATAAAASASDASSAADATRQKAYIAQSEKLLELLAEDFQS